MRILLLADEESKALWDFFSPDKIRGYDLIISRGSESSLSDPARHLYLGSTAVCARQPRHPLSVTSARAASAVKRHIFEYRGSQFWGWAVRCATRKGPSSTPKTRWQAASLAAPQAEKPQWLRHSGYPRPGPEPERWGGISAPPGLRLLQPAVEEYSPSYFCSRACAHEL